MPVYGFHDIRIARTLKQVGIERMQRNHDREAGFKQPEALRGGGAKFRRGKPAADIAAGQDGTINLWDEDGVTGDTIEVTNPYSITLLETEFVQVYRLIGWQKQIATPDQFTECAEVETQNVAPVQQGT